MGGGKISIRVGRGKGAKSRKTRRHAFRGVMAGMSSASVLPAAAAETRRAAEGGDARAQYLMGAACAAGAGVRRDLAEAFRWYGLAAEQNSADGWFGLFSCYREGLGTPKDDARAFECCRRAAELGCLPAIANMGLLLRHGIGCVADEAAAMKWLRQGAEQGSVDARHSLACLLQAQGTPDAEREAFAWFQKAAEQGLAESQANVAILLETGTGCEADPAEAALWWRRAAEQNVPLALYRHALNLLGADPPDRKAGLEFLGRAADAGVPDAEYLFGNMVVSGAVSGVSRERGIAYLRAAAKDGISRASVLLQAMESANG
ncbi:MAG: sel1 repeat family protein [Desulfovibrio sp.]|nr:sel1 repeat family protein [Desulfovibrio sp.]